MACSMSVDGYEIFYKQFGILMTEETVLQAMFPELHTALVLYMVLPATTSPLSNMMVKFHPPIPIHASSHFMLEE